MTIGFKNISSFLNTGRSRLSRVLSYFGLGIGVLLLLSSMQLFINIHQLLKENNVRKNGFDFISVTKAVTNENMGRDNTFKQDELNQLKTNPLIAGVSPMISNQYRVKASAGTFIPFSTDLFLESIDNDFIDTLPPDFNWQRGKSAVPIIFSSDFLEIYNVFAPSQDLPQLSDKTLSSVNIILTCYGPKGVENFTGNIVGLSDRINSVLVPKSFMDWSNEYFSGINKVNPSRIYLKTKDANDPRLLKFMDQNNYRINKDKTKFGRIKQVLQNIVSALGIFGILVIVLALMLFSFYLQLMIARSKENLQLLMTLGYSPHWLSKTVARTWIPVYASVVIIAIIITGVMHYYFGQISFVEKNNLPVLLHWSVLAVGLVLLFLSVFTNYRLVKNELNQNLPGR
jgi:ABC-type lipoprotein release transport system permease subunit